MYNYSEKHNILFVHIPKNAGTSIINSLVYGQRNF